MTPQFRTLALGSAIVLCSCSLSGANQAAEQAVSEFHRLYNAEDYAAIFDSADAAFQHALPEAEYVTFMSAVHRKLGLHKASAPLGWQVSAGLQGKQVRLSFRSEFAEGSATEQFLYRVSSGKPHLVGYNVNSPVLVIK